VKKFFLISQVFYPDEVSTANLFTKLSAKIAEDNHLMVDVWCAQPSYSTLKRQPRHLVYKNINITYLRSTNFKKDHFFGRLMNYLTFTISVVLKLLFSKDKTPVFTHTTPPSLGIIISLVCKLKKRKFIYVLLDIFPDGMVRLGRFKDKSLLVKIWKKINKKAFKRCHQIVVIGRDMKKWLLNFYPAAQGKIQYIPLWQDEELIQPVEFEQNPFVTVHKLNKKFVVQYSGNMGLWNDMETLGKVTHFHWNDVHFMFIGGGMRKKELLTVLEKPVPEYVQLIPFLSNKEYANAVSACHVALVSLQKDLEGMAVPSKIIGIMAAGIPVIAVVPEQSEIASIVHEENCGLVVLPDDVHALKEAIEMLKNNDKLRKQMAQNGRLAFEKKYTTTMVAEKYKQLLEFIATDNRNNNEQF